MNEWTKDDIYDVIEKRQTAILYFYTPLCGTCHIAGKMIDVVAEMIRDIPFGKADLNYMPEIAEHFSIESVPCLILMNKGNVAEKIYAFHSVPYLYDLIKKYY